MENKKHEDNLVFAMVILFMMSLFGHNLQRLWKPRDNYKLAGIKTTGKEVIESDLWIDEKITDPVIKKRQRKIKVKIKKNSTHVTVTRYNPVKNQCDGNPLVTADLSEIN